MTDSDHIIILVTDQVGCERLIRAGSLLRSMDYPDHNMRVLCIQPRSKLGDSASALQYLFNISRDVDAEMVVLYSDEPTTAAVDYIRKCETSYVVHGQNPEGESEFIEALRYELSYVSFMEIPYPIIQSDALLHYTA